MLLPSFFLLASVFISSFFLSRYFSSNPTAWMPLDHPTHRSLHTLPTPRTGGVAILLSLLIGFFLICFFQTKGYFSFLNGIIYFKENLWIAGMYLLTCMISLLDDGKSISPSIRLGIHCIASIGVVWGGNLKMNQLTIPFLVDVNLGALSIPFTVFFILWMMNLYNFMDGMDGFAGGMTVFGLGFLDYFFWRGGNHILALISSLITSATGGFLFHNLPPAKIFMGDAGSVPLGFLTAMLIISGIKQKIFDIGLPIIIFSPFFVDATVTLFKRILKRKNIWMAHREHYYQRLVLAGWGHTKTLMAEYALMISCGLSALVYVNLNDIGKLLILFFWILIYTFLILKVSVLRINPKENHQ